MASCSENLKLEAQIPLICSFVRHTRKHGGYCWTQRKFGKSKNENSKRKFYPTAKKKIQFCAARPNQVIAALLQRKRKSNFVHSTAKSGHHSRSESDSIYSRSQSKCRCWPRSEFFINAKTKKNVIVGRSENLKSRRKSNREFQSHSNSPNGWRKLGEKSMSLIW